jgi:hypothetical protein
MLELEFRPLAGYASSCIGEFVFDLSGKDNSKERNEDIFVYPGGKRMRRKVVHTSPGLNTGETKSKNLDPTKNYDALHNSAPVRERKIKQAIRKKQRGDYNNEEVYQKIADKLMDLFGVK